jgi:hypothetical protein
MSSSNHAVWTICLSLELGFLVCKVSGSKSVVRGSECGVMWQMSSWMLSVINRATLSAIHKVKCTENELNAYYCHCLALCAVFTSDRGRRVKYNNLQIAPLCQTILFLD